MFTVLACATLLLLTATLLPLSRCTHWLVRDLDYPRLQIAAFAFVLLLAQWALLEAEHWSEWGIMALTLICLLGQCWWIAPYTSVWPVEVPTAVDDNPSRSLKILTANVLTTNRDASSFLALVREHQPDVLVTLESNAWWQQRLDALESDMPYTIKCPLENLYGMHVYSKLPLQKAQIEYLVQPEIPSMHAQLVLRSGDEVRVHFLHPAPPSPTENRQSSERDAELIVVARSVAKSEQPLIVTGDLNDVAWSATTRLFRKISGLLDPRVGRGMYSTFNAKSVFMRWPLDHLFHSDHFTIARLQRLPPFGSDHFALLGELVFNPQRTEESGGLEQEPDDDSLAHAIINDQDVVEADVPQPGDKTAT